MNTIANTLRGYLPRLLVYGHHAKRDRLLHRIARTFYWFSDDQHFYLKMAGQMSADLREGIEIE